MLSGHQHSPLWGTALGPLPCISLTGYPMGRQFITVSLSGKIVLEIRVLKVPAHRNELGWAKMKMHRSYPQLEVALVFHSGKASHSPPHPPRKHLADEWLNMGGQCLLQERPHWGLMASLKEMFSLVILQGSASKSSGGIYISSFHDTGQIGIFFSDTVKISLWSPVIQLSTPVTCMEFPLSPQNYPVLPWNQAIAH
jgi:hypothetical protein